MTTDRRSFLAALGGATLGLAYGARTLDALTPLVTRSAKLERIGIQLYTVRRLASADLAGTLAQLAKIGINDVELAGLYNHTAVEFRDLLKANGLGAPSAHIAIDQIENDPAKTFDDAHALGLQWITVPSLPRGSHVTSDDWKKVAA
jgi:hypothetical protein